LGIPIVAALVALVALSVFVLLNRNRSTPVTVADAVSRYRSATTLAGQAADVATDPHSGVYRYATKGQESINALGGSKHAYPTETTVTLTAAECGWSARWDAVVERWRDDHLCRRADGIYESRFVEYHEFFNHKNVRTLECDGEPLVMPAEATPVRTWQFTCTDGSVHIAIVGTTVGVENLNVGGTSTPVIHVHFESTTTGDASGHGAEDVWFEPTRGLYVRRICDASSDSMSVIGTTNYIEHFELDLMSLEPTQ
jgi:hypothetical protein